MTNTSNLLTNSAFNMASLHMRLVIELALLAHAVPSVNLTAELDEGRTGGITYAVTLSLVW